MALSYKEDIRGLALFADMDETNFGALMRGAYVQNFPPRIDLIHENEPPDFLHVVLSGSVDLFSAWNGRETSIDSQARVDIHFGRQCKGIALSDVRQNT